MGNITPGFSAPISWDLVILKPRIDSGSFEELQATLKALRLQGKNHIALELKATRFISLGAIQYIVSMAAELKEQGGEMVLVSPPEKVKRHFEIYGSLKCLRLIRDSEVLGVLASHELLPLQSPNNIEV